MAGGPLASKPTWFSTFRVFSHVGFLLFPAVRAPMAGYEREPDNLSGRSIMGGKTDVAKGRIKEAASIEVVNDGELLSLELPMHYRSHRKELAVLMPARHEPTEAQAADQEAKPQ